MIVRLYKFCITSFKNENFSKQNKLHMYNINKAYVSKLCVYYNVEKRKITFSYSTIPFRAIEFYTKLYAQATNIHFI